MQGLGLNIKLEPGQQLYAVNVSIALKQRKVWKHLSNREATATS